MKQLLPLLVLLCIFTNKGFSQGWGQIQKIVAADRHVEQDYGWSIAIQGDIAAIGARSDNEAQGAAGSVYMFVKDASDNWIQTQKLIHSNSRQWDRFGQSLAIDGNYMIVGARGQDYDENNANFEDAEGAAYIFEKDGSGNWIEIQKIVASDRGETFQAVFGETVAISGNYAVVNKPTEKGDLGINAGVCYIFERDTNGIWSEVQKITNSHRTNDDRFGDNSISISGNILAIGARQHDYDASGQNEILSAGAVYIFERDNNGVWNETQKIVAMQREQGEFFGSSVAINGNQIIVGASQEYSLGDVSAQYGAIYIFEQDGNGVYNEIQKIRPDALMHQSKFGHSLAVDGNNMIVGAYFQIIGSAGFGGAAFMFDKDGSGFWNQTATMYDLDASSQDRFGFAVALSGDFAIVGAHQEDEDENGANSISQAGSAYVFDVNQPNTLPPLSTLSITENNFDTVIKAYPNPVKNNLNIDLGSFNTKVSVEVYNYLSQKIISKTYLNTNTVNLPLKVSIGIYLVKVKANNTTSILKVLKK